MDKYDRFHTHTHKVITISVHNHHHLCSLLWLSPFLYRQCHHPRPAKGRRQNQILKSILEPFLRDPQLTHTTTTETPSHVDPSPNFRQNWTLRAKWHSALTGIRVVNKYSCCRCCESLEQAKQWWMEQPRSESTRCY